MKDFSCKISRNKEILRTFAKNIAHNETAIPYYSVVEMQVGE